MSTIYGFQIIFFNEKVFILWAWLPFFIQNNFAIKVHYEIFHG